ncbi:winged helix-turn-helix transcriptional regulator [Rhodococcoides fascians]|uniref:winged helix-turn-helix transcriptional regulator n=1 Tax=Rhodococcoides fascians TaxID=1828 RepID=UPI00050BF426|nr:helix-turn-helix domain-containing protein [Rhodococcus fascians]
MRHAELADVPCSISRSLSVLGDRWTLVILKWSFAGVRRFNHFQSAMGISRSRLQDRLDRLVEHDILSKVQTDSTYAEYRLTRKGHDIYPILMAFKDWGDAYMAPDGVPVHYTHRDCGGNAHVRLECDSCGDEITARQVLPAPAAGNPLAP